MNLYSYVATNTISKRMKEGIEVLVIGMNLRESLFDSES
jgi:hypothetical protein